MGSICNWRQSL